MGLRPFREFGGQAAEVVGRFVGLVGPGIIYFVLISGPYTLRLSNHNAADSFIFIFYKAIME